MDERHVFIVDDEKNIRDVLKKYIASAGYRVTLFENGKGVLEEMRRLRPDMLVLDIMMPGEDGLDLCRKIRAESEIPIIFVSARDEEFDKVLGLELGADDYLTKPFSPREVVARVKAILRRTRSEARSGGDDRKREEESVVSIGKLKIYPEKYEAFFDDRELTLTPKEFELLLYLANNLGKVLTRDHLLNAVWDYDYIGDSRIVDVHVSHLREKIEEDTKQPKYIKTIRGLGYKMEGPSR